MSIRLMAPGIFTHTNEIVFDVYSRSPSTRFNRYFLFVQFDESKWNGVLLSISTESNEHPRLMCEMVWVTFKSEVKKKHIFARPIAGACDKFSNFVRNVAAIGKEQRKTTAYCPRYMHAKQCMWYFMCEIRVLTLTSMEHTRELSRNVNHGNSSILRYFTVKFWSWNSRKLKNQLISISTHGHARDSNHWKRCSSEMETGTHRERTTKFAQNLFFFCF